VDLRWRYRDFGEDEGIAKGVIRIRMIEGYESLVSEEDFPVCLE
jgi:hypothetical protein